MYALAFDNEDSFEDEIDDCMVAELAVLKSSRYLLRGSYGQCDSNWNACSMMASI